MIQESNFDSFSHFTFQDVLEARPYYDHLYGTIVPSAAEVIKEIKKTKKITPKDPLFKKKIKKIIDKNEEKFKTEIMKKFDSIQNLYMNALSGGYFEGQDLENANLMILGSDYLRDKNLPLDDISNFKILSSTDEEKGAILKETSFWNLLANDAVMLGVIQSHKEVWISTLRAPTGIEKDVSMRRADGTPTIDDDILWSTEENRFRVLGREVAQLRAAGYVFDSSVPRDYGFCLRCPKANREAASRITLQALCKAAEETTFDEIKEFLNLNPPR